MSSLASSRSSHGHEVNGQPTQQDVNIAALMVTIMLLRPLSTNILRSGM